VSEPGTLFRTVPADAPAAVRRRPLDNPRVLAVLVLLLVGVLGGLYWLSTSTTEIALPLLTDVILYALLGVDLALLVALFFVLIRNLLKLWVEQRHAVPFARFRGKFVAALLAMSIIPAVLVLISGSQIIRTSAERWFSEPVEEVLSASNTIALRWYQERQQAMAFRAGKLAATIPASVLVVGDEKSVDLVLREEVGRMRDDGVDGMVELYRIDDQPGRPPGAALISGIASTPLALENVRASSDRIAERAVQSGQPETADDQLPGGGVLVRAAHPIRNEEGAVAGTVVVSQHLPADLRASAQLATSAYQRYQSLFLLKEPIQFVYLSIFLTVTLIILISATWLGLYLAKRITRPVQQLAEGARAIGAGRLDVRLEAETSDELGSLVEAFNMMAAELSTSREKVEQSRLDLERKNVEVDARRRYIETILERVATGVISLDAQGRISTVNGAAMRLFGLTPAIIGQPAAEVFDREELRPLLSLVDAAERRDARAIVQEIMIMREDRELHLAGAATLLLRDDGRSEGAVLVLDDVTPLIRAQRVAAWRDVARRLAHEIKNPLTPIQLSAERLRRYFGHAPPPTGTLVSECTDAIIVEVEALKGLVDEFAQFARMRGPRMVPADLNRLVEDTLVLYAGVLQQGTVRLERHFTADLPRVRLDAEQIRQVIINLIDNAIEALGGSAGPARPDGQPPTVRVSTGFDKRDGFVRFVVSDNGPGVPAADRDKLFMPYYSTKGRGSGLGLAIVRRIVVEHGGSIEAGEAVPSGTTFTVELPAAQDV
jgi:two-component system nitrogen regulation sensor histidine kinase NtrY